MDGVIIVNKEKDYTSRDVVNILNKTLMTKKIGHTGTLDPMAEGVLVMCVGKALKLAELITAYDKEYVAEVTLGIQTDTLDITGTILKEVDANINKDMIVQVLKEMTKTYLQEVPSYSAVKINGKKLYEYARENIAVELPKKEVTINSLELVGDIRYENNKTIFTIKTTVSKGTYIRSLINDIAASLNTVGVMSALTRTRQGNFKIGDAFLINEIANNRYKLIGIKDLLPDYTIIKTDNPRVLNGNPIDNTYNLDKIMFVNNNDEPIGLYIRVNDQLRSYKMF